MGGCSGGCKEEFKGTNFKLRHDEPKLFLSSQWEACCGCSRIFYVIWRVLIALFFLAILICTGAVKYRWYTLSDDSQRIKWFIYLTNWCFFMLTIDVLIQAGIALYGYHRVRADGSYDVAFPAMTWYLRMQWVITNIATCSSILITIAFWAFIYTPTYFVHWVDYNTHATNTIYILVNLFVTAMPVRVYHCYQTIIYSIIYIIFSVIYHVASGTNALGSPYIYSVLDWNTPGTAALYAFILGVVAVIVIWLIYYGLYRLRLLIFDAILKKRGKVEDDNEMNTRGRENYGYSP